MFCRLTVRCKSFNHQRWQLVFKKNCFLFMIFVFVNHSHRICQTKWLFIFKSKICEKYIFTPNLEIRNKMESLIPRLRNRWTFPDKRFPKFCPIELVRDSWWHYKVLTFKLYFLSKLYFSYKNFPRILLTNVIDLKFNWWEFS